MEQYGTNKPFRVWVIASEPTEDRFSLDWVAFDDDISDIHFDDEAPPPTFAIFSGTDKRVVPLRFYRGHSQRRGPLLYARGPLKGIEPPYLITDLLAAHAVGEAEVEMKFTDRARELFALEWAEHIYPVRTNEWFGILTWDSGPQAHLHAFSMNAQARIRPGQTVHFSEWAPEDPAGVVEKMT